VQVTPKDLIKIGSIYITIHMAMKYTLLLYQAPFLLFYYKRNKSQEQTTGQEYSRTVVGSRKIR
jgi:hypothetical protein